MRFAKVAVVVLVLAGFGSLGCHSHRKEGPAERAGEKIDEGIGKMGEKLEEGGEKLQEKSRGY